MKKNTILWSAVVAVTLVAGCSTADEPSAAESSTPSLPMPMASGSASSSTAMSYNEYDVSFNQMMIPHHQQAVAMAELVADRTTTAAVRDLATRIQAAQQPEIDEMTARLAAWGVATPSTHEGHAMPGTMTDDDMSALAAADGTAFDRLWLQQMIAHHQGAVEMSDDELAEGIDPSSRELATRIRVAQQAEIDEMNRLLNP
ncbi:DUF305 domain-containing protein [Gordonia rhizosphera]|uniref:DUF305 domain-containing protein n=1 Tax=Gordonia rhizosphera NBRC 16068 TaxID=1108045 RepID=K6VZX1_9ACTN|nr:DUF305 domain-containing protein [Gordonia rhizosphera]GAB92460.1 hypothetical protein GORHZ_180_00190 [Gordonia rhizosphera NBRC 16068]